MKQQQITLFSVFSLFFFGELNAATITQCVQPDGTIEFTNQGCSKSNSYNSKATFNRYSSQSLVSKTKKNNKRRTASFRKADFISLQNKLLKAETMEEVAQRAQIITDKVRTHAKNGELKLAYNMIAATYVKLSKDIKQKHWEGQKINPTSLKIRTLFEEILITQSTISTADEFNQAIKTAWKNHQSPY